MRAALFAGALLIELALVGSILSLKSQIDDVRGHLQQTQAQLVQVSAKAAGAHRDLITCADLQGLGLQVLLDVGLNTNADGSLSAVPDQQPVQLPSHCINQ